MKYIPKCMSCNRKATTKWRGVALCDECRKQARRNHWKGVYAEYPILSLGSLTIYEDRFIPFK